MPEFILEITGGDVSLCTMYGDEPQTSELWQDVVDCTGSGDAEPACDYLRPHVEFRTIKRNESGEVVNVIADASDKEHAARAIYFESDSDFTDERTAELYLIWQAASNAVES